MERVNQELDQYLQLFVNEWQDDWYDLLPMVEFQHNNHVHSATQQPPFLLNTGYIPRMGFEPQQNHSNLEMVNEFMERMRTAIEEAKSAICKAQDDIKRYYDRRRTLAPVFKPGDKVFLDTSDIHTMRPSQKLLHQWLGPFVVEQRIGPMAYRLRLPHGERGKRDVDCDKQVEKAVTAPNCMLKGSWGEGGSGGIRKKLKSEYAAYLESKYRRNDRSSI